MGKIFSALLLSTTLMSKFCSSSKAVTQETSDADVSINAMLF